VAYQAGSDIYRRSSEPTATSKRFGPRLAAIMQFVLMAVFLWSGPGAANALETNDPVGYSVSVSGDYAVVGAAWHDGFKGAAYLLRRDGGGWTLMQTLSPPDLGDYDHFGGSVAMDGDVVVVGATWHDLLRGAAYVFVRNGDEWGQSQKLTANDAAVDDRFGQAVQVHGTDIRVATSAKAGAHGFKQIDGRWIEGERTGQPAPVKGDADAQADLAESIFASTGGDLATLMATEDLELQSAADVELTAPEFVKATGGELSPLETSVRVMWGMSEPQDAVIFMVERDSHLLSIVSSDETQYDDVTAKFGQTYEYCIVVMDMTSEETIPVCAEGKRIIFAPTDVTATDGVYADKVRVEWVDRSAVNTGYTIKRNGTEIDSVGADATEYDDVPAQSGTVYQYDVTAVADGGYESLAASGGSGWMDDVLPPLDVVATDGQYLDRVFLNWTIQGPTDHQYVIYRDNEWLGETPAGASSFVDSTVVFGMTYEYCVAAKKILIVTGVNKDFQGTDTYDVSESIRICDEGGTGLDAPLQVSASDSTYDDRIRVTWEDVSDLENGYEVLRSYGGDTIVLGTTEADVVQYDDFLAGADTTYTYHLRAVSDLGGVSTGVTDTGFRSLILAPTDVVATDGDYEDHVDITWSSKSTTAVLFAIYRGADFIKSVSSEDRIYRDYAGTAGVVYDYEVRAYTAQRDMASGSIDQGRRDLIEPTLLEATFDTYEDRTMLTWVDNSNLEAGYQIVREDTVSASADTLMIGPNRSTYSDYEGLPGVTYRYRVSAFDDSNGEDGYSSPEVGLGRRTLMAPTAVTADKGLHEDSIEIRWRDNSDAEQAYRIYRDDLLIGSSPDNTISFVDTDPILGQTHAYAVCAYDSVGESEPGTDTGYSALLGPVSFNASDVYSDRVELTWIDRSGIEDGFEIFRDGELIKRWAAPNATSYTCSLVPVANTLAMQASPYDVEVRGRYAYVAGGSGLYIVDILDPANPALAGEYTTADNARSVTVTGDIAYVAGGTAGMHIIDVSDPASPALLAEAGTTVAGLSIVVAGDYAYVADSDLGLVIIDISDPSMPVPMTPSGLGVGGFDVTTEGDLVYLASRVNGLVIIDAGDPAQPELIWESGSSDARTVTIDDDYAYVTTDEDGIQIYDISNPSTTSQVGGFVDDLLYDGRDLGVIGDYAYVASLTQGMVVLDISVPALPRLIEHHTLPGSPHGLDVDGAVVYLAVGGYEGENGLHLQPLQTITTGRPADFCVRAYNDSITSDSDCDSGLVPIVEIGVGSSDLTEMFTADDAMPGDQFGASLDMSDDVLIVGVPLDDQEYSAAGAAYIFQRDGTGWIQQQMLLAIDRRGGDLFGRSAAVDGDVAVVGAPYESRVLDDSGSAYVFERGGDGTWTYSQKIRASDAGVRDQFGQSVDVHKGVMVVSSPVADAPSGNPYDYGSAYVFENTGSTWTETRALGISNPAAFDSLGNSVAVGDSVVVLGAPGRSGSTGAAYVFEADETTGWPATESAELIAIDGEPGDEFGYDVAVYGDIVIVGACGDDAMGWRSGSAYVFNRGADGVWAFAQKLTAGTDSPRARFGFSVAISQDALIVGALNDDETGAAYIFKQDPAGLWFQSQKISLQDGKSLDLFGYAVTIDDASVAIGVPLSDASGIDSGAVSYAELFAKPGNVEATDGTFDSRVRITWVDRSATEEKFTIFRDGHQIAQVAANVEIYEDFDAEPGRTYEYEVGAYQDGDANIIDRGRDFGWRPADGSITGRISTHTGAGADSVRVQVSELPTRALLLDDNEGHVDIPDSEGAFNFDASTSYTIETWFKFAGGGGYGADDGIMIGKTAPAGTSTAHPFSLGNLRGSAEPGQLRFSSSDGSTTKTIATVRNDLNDNRWHHVACVIDAVADSCRIYVDGILDNGDTRSGLGDVTNTAPLALGVGRVEGSTYQGQLDEVRIWNIALSGFEIAKAMSSVLTGNEIGLVAYWPIGWPQGYRAEEDAGVITDLAGGAHYGTFEGGVYWTDDCAPLDIDPLTDTQGNYVFDDLYYGTQAELNVRPYSGNKQFDPPNKRIVLTTNSPVENQVNFSDVSSYTVSGTIRYADTDCAAANIPIFVDSQPAGATDSRGNYAVTADLGERSVRPFLQGHAFSPDSCVVVVENDTPEIDFNDSTVYVLSGGLGGGCGRSVGEITITVRSENDCFVETYAYADSISEYSVSLPPQNYFVSASVDSVPAGLSVDDVTNFFQTLGERYIELNDAGATMDFVYRAPLTVTIEGFEDFVETCSGPLTYEDRVLPDHLPVIPQSTVLRLILRVNEDYGVNGYCPLENGTVTIYDELWNLEDTPLVLQIQDGLAGSVDTTGVFIPHYQTVAATPGLIVGRTDELGNDRTFQKRLRAVVEVDGRSPVEVSQWALITGHVAPEGADFVTMATEEMPLFILRDPPGDHSYAFLEEGYTFANNISHMQLQTTSEDPDAINSMSDCKYGLDITHSYGWSAFGVEVGLEFPFAIQYHHQSKITNYITTDSEDSVNISTRTEERYATSADELFTGGEGDVFIGAGMNFTFSEVDVIEVDEDCQVHRTDSYGFEPEGFSTGFVYTGRHISDVLIPELESHAARFVGIDEDSVLIFTEKADRWQDILAENEAMKLSASFKENRTFSAGADYLYSLTTEQTDVHTSIKTLSFEKENNTGAILNMFGLQEIDDMSVTFEMEHRVASFEDTEETTRSTVGYVLSDDDIGDRFTVDVKQDDRYPTPVFDVLGGASSCPFEAWPDPTGAARMLSRDNPWHGAFPAQRDSVPPDRPAVFTLQLSNQSETSEPRLYALRLQTASNPGGAVVRVAGEPIMNGLQEYYIDFGDEAMQEATLTVERGPSQNVYEDLTLILYPPCEYELWQQGAAMQAAYTLPISVTFEDQGPLAFGTPEPADGELSFGEDIKLTFNETIDCGSIQGDAVSIRYLDGPDEGSLLTIDRHCDGRTIILEPSVDPDDLEGRMLQASVGAIRDQQGNAMAGAVTWEFEYRKSLFTWSNLQLSHNIDYFNPGTLNTELVNGTNLTVAYTLPEPAEDWFTLSPMSGTLAPGANQVITLDIRDDLPIGTYETQVTASSPDIDPGAAVMDVHLTVTCGEPDWIIEPSSFEHSMTMVAEVHIDGGLSDDPNDRLAAFVGNQLRGVASIDNINGLAQPHVAFLTIFSNRSSGETVRFKVWDDDECRLYNATDTTYPFVTNEFIGRPDIPVPLVASNTLGDDVHTVAVSEGWTLISTNVYSAADMTVSGVLSDLTPAPGDIIKSHSAFSQFVDNSTGWSGSLTDVDNVSGYMVRLEEPGLILHTGSPVEPPFTIPVYQHWNWISYLPDAAYPTTYALSGLTDIAVTGDVIKSQDAFAEYVAPQWYGSLSAMEPGKGYKLYLAQPDPGEDSFDYPAVPLLGAGPAASSTKAKAGAPTALKNAPSWTVDPHAYQNNMTVTAVLRVGSIESIDEQDMVAAFAGDQCRGVAQPVYIEGHRRYVVFLMVHSNEADGEELTLRAFDANGDAVHEVIESLTFEADLVQGNVQTPVIFTTALADDDEEGALPKRFALVQVRPNPFNPSTTLEYDVPANGGRVAIRIYDVAGRLVKSLVDGAQTAGRQTVTWGGRNDRDQALATGIYFVRMTAPGYEKTRKVLMVK